MNEAATPAQRLLRVLVTVGPGGLGPLAVPLAEEAARADGDGGLDHLEALAQGVPVGVQDDEDPFPLVGLQVGPDHGGDQGHQGQGPHHEVLPRQPPREEHGKHPEEDHHGGPQVGLKEEEGGHGKGEEAGEEVVPDPPYGAVLQGAGQGQDQAELGQLKGLELQGPHHEPGPGPVDLPPHHEN